MKRFKRNKNNYVLVFFVSAMLFFVIHTVIQKKEVLEKSIEQCALPFLKINVFVSRWYQEHCSAKKAYRVLLEQVCCLQKEKELLLEKCTMLESTYSYASKIESIITFAQRYDVKKMRLCQVLLKKVSDNEQTFIIEGGLKHGIAVDMAVVYKGNLVGKIIHVFDVMSIVILITDKRCNVSSYCLKTKTRGILRGLNNDQEAQLYYVDRLSYVEDQDIIVSSGEGLIFPEGFCLGTIVSISPDGVHYRIKVKPSLELSKIDYCYVVAKGELTVPTKTGFFD